MRQAISLLAVTLFLFSLTADMSAQRVESERLQSHGTINIFLANKNGLVAVTDSMLTRSNGTHPSKPAQKLFQLDDRTICTIAGAYFSPGPENDLDLRVSEIIWNFARELKVKPVGRLDQKLSALAFSLQMHLRINSLANVIHQSYLEPEPLRLTVAGYDEDGLLKIAEVKIVVVGASSDIQFRVGLPESISKPAVNQPVCEIAGIPSPGNPSMRSIGNFFVCEIAGIPNSAAESILFYPDGFRGANPDIKQLALLSRNNQLTESSTDELRAIAVALEDETDKSTIRHGHIVGGDKQIAVLRSGRIIEFQGVANDPADQPEPHTAFVTLLNGVTLSGFIGLFIDSAPGKRTIVVNGSLMNFRQVLDGNYFGHNTFQNMQLAFNGDEQVFWDPIIELAIAI